MHSPTNKPLYRRRVLQSSGASLVLPILSSLRAFGGEPTALASKQSDTSLPPRRFCCIFFPNGVSLPPEDHPDHQQWSWFPHTTGIDYRFNRPLKPLAAYRQDLTILSGLSHPAMRSSIAHITADSFLTGADSSQFYTNSISLDQLLAGKIGQSTRFPSLTLSSDGGVGAPGRTHTLSFDAAGRPIPSLSDPRSIYDRLFGVQGQSNEQKRQAFGRDRSIMDHVLEEMQSLQRGLSAEDRRRLDEYSESVRTIERRLASADRWLDANPPEVDPRDIVLDVTARGDAQDYIRAILDLMLVALQTDTTRVITYQITSEDAKGIGDRFPTSLGLPGHHALSHGLGHPEGYRNWAKYDEFLATQLGYFIGRLKATPDPLQDGSLLENTLLYYGCSTSRTHLAANYPLILAGGQRLGFRHGSFRTFDESKVRLSDL
ncbi:MAG TPA: hypothetical protein DDW52_05850, partial [Planctomycetaceae bacterium]|nr:hypothetical protein [Planctomycetaceae bacterium]